jgi:hypothetical protein
VSGLAVDVVAEDGVAAVVVAEDGVATGVRVGVAVAFAAA